MRVDVYLVLQGYAESRNKAARLILDGAVLIDGNPVKKTSENIDEKIFHEVFITQKEKYVGRGGLKLEEAIKTFGINVSNGRYIDVGASTGGFTECLLQNGALHVTALDSGHGQLHPKLANDRRVRSVEGYNARNLNPADVGMFDGAVMDVSFISQTAIIPALKGVIKEDGFLVSLIKPQFEAGKSAMGKNGIVKSRDDRIRAVTRVLSCACDNHLDCIGVINSPIHGGDGNIEYLAYFLHKESTQPKNISLDELE